MKYRVHLSAESTHDIQEIYEYIAYVLLAPINAESVFDRIREDILSLNEMPERHRIYKTDSSGQEIRFFVSGNHIIFYCVDSPAAQVNVIRVLYGGADIEKELDLQINRNAD